MAKKNVDAKLKVTDVPLQEGVDAEVSYSIAESANADKQWLEETSKVWANRQASEKQHESSKAKGDAVVNVADAAGAVGEKTGASIILADASNKDDDAVVVKKKDDDSDDKAGYIWGGLGLLGLVGIALAAGGGGGGGGGSLAPTPLNLDGLVIDDPVGNAIVFRDYFGDGRLHVYEVYDGDVATGRYIVDSRQAVTVTDDEGKFANLGGSGRIISVGINRLPLAVYEDDDFDGSPELVTAEEGNRLFTSALNEERDSYINDGNLAYIVGEDQVFDSLVISSGITLSVRGEVVTLVTGVTALVDAYVTRDRDDDEGAPTSDEIRTAIYEVADLFGYELDASSSDEEIMSFLLGGYDVQGIDSPNNLNQEIYSVINSIYVAIEAVEGRTFGGNDSIGDDIFDGHDSLVVFVAALDAILQVQEDRLANNDDNLATFATNPDLVADVINEFIELYNRYSDVNTISNDEAQLLVDVAINHANFGGGAADIYEADDDYGYSSDLVNMVKDGEQLFEYEVERAGNITVLAGGYGDSADLYLGLAGEDSPVELLGSNILVSAYGEDSSAFAVINAENASGSLMSNGTYTFDESSDDEVPLGDITVQAVGEDSYAQLYLQGDLEVAGDVSVVASGEDSLAAGLIIGDDDGYYGPYGGVATSLVLDVDLRASLLDPETSRLDKFKLYIDDVLLEATVNVEEVTESNVDEVIKDIVSQWVAEPEFTNDEDGLSGNVRIDYWGDYARISFIDTESHDVDVHHRNGRDDVSEVAIELVQENYERDGEINFQGSHLEVIASGDDGNYNYGVGYGSIDAALLVLGATGTVNGIDVIADAGGDIDRVYRLELQDLYDYLSNINSQIDINTFFELRLPGDRVISANIYNAITSLSLDPPGVDGIYDLYNPSEDASQVFDRIIYLLNSDLDASGDLYFESWSYDVTVTFFEENEESTLSGMQAFITNVVGNDPPETVNTRLWNFSYERTDINALGLVNIDGTVEGEINVIASEGTEDNVATLTLTASAGGLSLDDVDMNVISYGDDSYTELRVGSSSDLLGYGIPFVGEDNVPITGSVNDITVSAQGVDASSEAFIRGDLTIGGTITVETTAEDAYAALDLESNFGSTFAESVDYIADDVLADSFITYESADIVVSAYGDDAEALLDADGTNGQGSINSITVIANADAALDGDLNATSAYAEIEELTLNGTVRNITVKAVGEDDYAELEMDSSSNRSLAVAYQVFTLDDLEEDWEDLQAGNEVSIKINDDITLTAIVSQDVNGNYSRAVEVLADVVSQFQAAVDARNANNDLSDDLNIVFKQTGNVQYIDEETDLVYSEGRDGIWVRWLESGEQPLATLSVEGTEYSPTEYDLGRDVTTSIEFLNSDILVEATGFSSDAIVNIADATGRIKSLTLLADGWSADADIDIEMGGRLGNVTVTATGEDAQAEVEMNTAPQALVYDNSIITLEALGDDANVQFHQEGYATGTINTLTSRVIGHDGAQSDIIIGGDITFDSEINVYTRSTQINSGADNYVHLANEDRDEGMNSTFHMTDVTINVDSFGYNAYSELSTQNWQHNGFSSDSSIDSMITGTISELNVSAGVYDPAYGTINPELASNARSDVFLNVHGVIESINIHADNVSEVNVDLYGDINANGVMAIDITNSDSGSVDFHLDDVYGDIDSINVSSDEDAETWMSVETTGSINSVTITTDDGAHTYASFDISGAENFIKNLTINTIGTDFDEDDYTTVASIDITQGGHGGVVNIVNGPDNLYADTVLTYFGDFQADQINIFGLSPRVSEGNVFAGINNNTQSVIGFSIGPVANATNYVAGQVANIDGFGTLVIQPNGAYSFTADPAWNGTWPNISYATNAVSDITFDLSPTFNDYENDRFGLQINMPDMDYHNPDHQTILEDNMTTIFGLTSGRDNPFENYIQFGALDDDNYNYEPSSEGDTPNNPALNISHYSDGLIGWRGGYSSFNQFEASDENNFEYDGDGFYGSMNAFFDAAQYGIASEYAFIDLNRYSAAGGTSTGDLFDTDIQLIINYTDGYDVTRTIYLDWDLSWNDVNYGDDDFNGLLLAGALTTQDFVNGLNSDSEWDTDNSNDGAWGSSYESRNLTLFANGDDGVSIDDGILGIRIGEGRINSVQFKSNWTDNDTDIGNVDTSYSGDSAYSNDSADDGYSINFDSTRVDFVDGGGYFFGMVINDDGETYRGMIAMDKDGEGVTKLIELADVIADFEDVTNYINDTSYDGSTIGYDEFSANYIGIASGYVYNSDGFDYSNTVTNAIVYDPIFS